MKSGLEWVGEAREKQFEKGYTPETDKGYVNNELTRMAISYLRTPFYNPLIQSGKQVPADFPFRKENWKPSPEDRIKELAKAGATICAEIDRLQTQNK